MRKNLQINIPIDTQSDVPEDVLAIIVDIMQIAIDKHYKPITSIMLDEKEIFNHSRGFSKYLNKEYWDDHIRDITKMVESEE